jgi:hypothetical protein
MKVIRIIVTGGCFEVKLPNKYDISEAKRWLRISFIIIKVNTAG